MSTKEPRMALAAESSDMWATFVLSDELFAVRVEDVQEVMMNQPLTPVPLAPRHILGLLNLRGQIMPAIDMRVRLQFSARDASQGSKLLVLKTRDGLISVVVDQIGDVLQLPLTDWRSVPDTLAGHHRVYVTGVCPINRQVVLGLNVNALCGEDDRSKEVSLDSRSNAT